jgi:hypothetical protein
VIVAFEDETTTITQKPCIRKPMSFEDEQEKIEHIMVVDRSFLHIHIHGMA